MTARILIIDDVAANTRLLEAKLGAEYYQVKSATDGHEGILTARDWQPDVILLDIMMPGMDGYHCCRLLKNDPVTLHIPIVMITALGEATERLCGLEAGADDFLTKPVDFETLKARIRSLIRLKRLLDESRARGLAAKALGLQPSIGAPVNITGRHLIMINDWPKVTDIVSSITDSEGLTLTTVSTLAELIGISSSGTFSLAIVNLGLSEVDPIRCVAEVRAGDITHQLPILLIAEEHDREHLFRGIEFGANDWVMQPIDANELRARCRNQIRRKLYQDRLKSDLEQMVDLAMTDQLTGAYNRRYLLQYLQSLEADRSGRDVSILIVDIDHFKLVNDSFGHEAGDIALRCVAQALKTNTRIVDTVARFGGEEFVIAMPAASLSEAEAIAQRLRKSIEALEISVTEGQNLRLTVSIGIASGHVDADYAEHLLREADKALYVAKREGRNRVVKRAR